MIDQLSKLQAWSRSRQEGQAMVEYALIIALVAVLLAGALTTLEIGLDGALRGAAALFQ